MLSDEEIIRSFDTEVTVAVVSFLERIGIDPHLEKFTTLPDEEIKQDFIEAYRSLREILPSLEDIPVRIAKLEDINGAFAMIDKNGNCHAILINKNVFALSKREALIQQNLDFGVKTNNPIGAILIHEFGHVLWTPRLPISQKAENEILKLYINWKKRYDAGNLPEYGHYIADAEKEMHQGLEEWWAETIAKAVVGTPDEYTSGAIKIIKNYLL